MKIIIVGICTSLAVILGGAMSVSFARGDAIAGVWLFVIAFVFGYIAVHVGLSNEDRS